MNKEEKQINNEQNIKHSSIINGSKYALTTFDNPYNPFSQFEEWLMFDNNKGYCSCAYLARIAHTSDQLSEEENNYEINRAINEILDNDFIGIYKKVENENYTP